nr:uncharacterized protein LOC112794519 [Arachis hypogaea]
MTKKKKVTYPLFNNQHTKPDLFWNSTDQQFVEKKNEKNKTAHLIRWRPPSEDWLKANVDAAFRKEDGKGAISVVIRNNNEKIVLGFSRKINTHLSITVEAIAIRQPLIIIDNLDLGKTLIELDSLKLIQTIKSNTFIGEIEAILQDIRELIKRLPNCGLTWTPKEGNLLAHTVAKMAASDCLRQNWSIQPPLEMRRIINMEAQR